jgi:esterase
MFENPPLEVSQQSSTHQGESHLDLKEALDEQSFSWHNGMMKFMDQFHCEFYGEKKSPPLVFLHGLMGSANNFRRIASDLKDHFYILCLDQRGHGKSFKPTTGFDPKDYANDLFQIMNDLGWSKISLVGHSMGGRNAIQFAYDYPQLLEKLVIEDIGPQARPDSILKIEKLLQSIPTPFESKLEAKHFFTNQFRPQILGSYLYTNIEQKADGKADWRFSLPAILESIRRGRGVARWSEFEQLKMPVLVIRGENSEDLKEDELEEMKLRNPKIQVKVIQKAGHWVHFDQPQQFTQALKDFLI